MARYKDDWKKYIETNRHLGISEHVVSSEYFRIDNVKCISDESLMVNNMLNGSYHLVDVSLLMENFDLNINEDLSATTLSINNIAKMLRRLFANSTFKDIHTTATALGIQKHLALTWIIEFCVNNETSSSAQVQTILQLLHKHDMDLFDWMLNQSFGVLSCYKGLIHPSLILEVVTSCKELWINTWLEEEKPKDLQYFTQQFNNYCYRFLKKVDSQALNVSKILF